MLKNIKSGFIICTMILAPCGLLLAAENNSGSGTDNVSIVKSQQVGNKICPVTGEKIGEKDKVTYEYKGKIYNLCCSGCIEEFKKDPNKYIQKIEKEMDDVSSSVEKNK
jgi:YHS domain-containing protein